MIELSHVTRRYEGQPMAALDDVSLQIAPAEFVAITGPSGCGKSTLMHLIGGMDQPTSGEIFVDGLALHRVGEKELTEYRRRKLGIVFQFFNLLPTMTVLENATLPLLLQGVAQAEADQRACELLEMVGLTPRLRQFSSQLSGGEMQRAAIARALVHRPSVLLADEPTGNLDSKNAGHVMELFREIAHRKLTTLVIVTHSAEVAAMATREIRMKDGRVVLSNI